LDHIAGNYYLLVVILFCRSDLRSIGFNWYFALCMFVFVCIGEAVSISKMIALELKLRRLDYPDTPRGAP
jgi:hypothetical protein